MLVGIPDKKYQIFISSTYKDLRETRDSVIKALLNLYQIPIGMEMFSANNEKQWKTIKTTIDNSDYYVLILGFRYGQETDEGFSYTEKEFDYAKSKGIPIYAFLRNEDVLTKPSERDGNAAAIDKLRSFREKVSDNAMVDFWEHDGDLTTKVITALTKAFVEEPRIGWIRGDQATSPKISEEVAVLSKENRELKQELKKHEQRILLRPKLEVYANDSKEVSLTIAKTRVWNLCLPVDKKDIPMDLLPKLPDNYIRDYNKSIEANAEMAEKYNEMYRLYQSESQSIVFSIINNGNAKATTIHVDIEAPEELKLSDKEDGRNKPVPKWPNEILMHPLNKSLENTMKLPWEKVSNLGFGHYSVSSLLPNKIHNNEKWQTFRDNKLTLFRKELLHTRKAHFDKISLKALKEGEYELKISCICEEFSEPEIEVIKVYAKAK